MLKRLSLAHLALLTAAAIVIACGSEQALLVSPRIDTAPPLGVVADPSGARIRPIRRVSPRGTDESWSFDVGPAGAIVPRPSSGLTISVPPGAVASTTHITVTALKGAAGADRVAPPGLQFPLPPRLPHAVHCSKL